MRIKQPLFYLLSILLILEPSLLSAQGLMGSRSYGQALGGRKQQTRSALPSQRGDSFNRGISNSLGMEGQEGALQRFQSGRGMSNQGSGYQIHLLGQVRQLGTYRLPPSTRMDEALGIAGGVEKEGSTRRVELRRSGKVTRYDLLRYRKNGDLSQNPFLLDNDVIFVPFAEKNVEIRGSVKNGGVYELTSREKNLWDLIQLAGGYTVGVSHEVPVTVIRFEDGEKQLLKVSSEEKELKNFKLKNGDIGVVAHILTDDRRFDYNVASLPADNVFYPSFNDSVFVIGAVALPGAYPFSPNYTIRDYVSMAGPIKYAKVHKVRVLTAEGRKIRKPEKMGFRVSPGDTLFVPERAWTSENIITWYNTLANSVIAGFTVRSLLRD